MSGLKKSPNPTINTGLAISSGLVAVYNLMEGTGGPVNLVDQTTLSLVNSGAWTQTGAIGKQLDCSVANDSGAQSTSPPAAMKPSQKVSLFWQGVIAASPSASSQFAGMTANNSDTAPFTSYTFAMDGTGARYSLDFNTDGTFSNAEAVPLVSLNGTERQVLITITTGTQKIYENGTSLTLTTGGSATYTNINYGANPTFGIGIYINGVLRNSKSKASLCYVWNRALTSAEALLLYQNPLIIFSAPFVSNKLRPRIFSGGIAR